MVWWFIRVVSEPRGRRSRCFRRSRWRSSAARKRRVWPPLNASWPPDAVYRPLSPGSSPSRRLTLSLQSSLVCGLEQASSPPEDNHSTVKIGLSFRSIIFLTIFLTIKLNNKIKMYN